MKFTIAAVALATGVSASYPVASYSASANTTTAATTTAATAYTTEVVTSYETYCPGPTKITYGSNTYTVTEATTLTITDCPCTISKPVYTTSSVACTTCTSAPVPVYPTSAPAPPPVYPNSTAPAVTPSSAHSTGSIPSTSTTPSTIPTAGAGKVAALSGAGLAGLLGLAVAAL
ncbi:uncharacterized protein GGS22DRAFT_132034 [Annulohypoxylon maeteangense]|uniref:uncharacterized protein n=1 Tax=Annulohypoxylon maeteangense TaxID=1927788 RepID=UPI00200767DE|nr:uncharacterized protein GGS22DRAFT_132034 [Annulohypoxylon maeteangense]KAI0885658.1 hypothetical protein GGS22DRAFT_132034 [Annulohypoxylon maeteangense]